MEAKFSGSHDTWENELADMNVGLYSDNVPFTDAPEEMVYVLGRPDYSKGCPKARVGYVNWLKNNVCDSSYNKAIKLESGKNPVCIGTITVHDSRDRLPIIQQIERFGTARLAFVDIRNPWVD